MMISWFGAFLVLVLATVSGHAADEGSGGERAKEPSRAVEPKKKQDAETKSDSTKSESTKPDSNGKPLAEDKAKTEEPPPTKPEAKPEETPKKPVTSVNLAIKLALMADPQLFPLEVEVEMDKGKAILSGSVPTEEDKARVTEVAGKVEGVEAVVNKLSVVPTLRATWAKKQDEAIAHFVRDRLVRSETLKAVGFEVKSESGVVHLSGKTRFQVIALEAAEAARQVPGVRAVDTTGVQIIAKD
ncbi:MAG TPA: BON domain-containing protein [Nitrospira sp.]